MNAKMFSSFLSYITPRTREMVFIILFFSVLAYGPAMLNADGDLPRHLLMGKYVVEGNSPPTTEIFVYPYEGRKYVPHEWGTGVVFYLLFQAFELNGVVFLAGLLIAGAFLLVFSSAVKSNNEAFLTLVLVALGALVTFIHWITRPHLFSMLLVALWLVLLDGLYQNNDKRFWVFPFIMLLWANFHAEFIAGFLILGAYLADSIWSFWHTRTAESLSKIKTLFLVLVLSFACALINPSGIQAWITVAGYLNNPYLMSTVIETRPPNFTEIRFMPLLILYVVSVAILLSQRKNFRLVDFLLIIGFGLMNAVSARNAHLFGVVAPFVLARGLRDVQLSQALRTAGQAFAKVETAGKGTAIPILSAILLGLLLLAGPYKSRYQFNPDRFPVQAVQWLEKNPQSGNMFNHFDWGGYILLHLWPSQKVFIESQADTHGDLTKTYLAVTKLEPGWGDIFQGYDIRWAIIPPDRELTEELKKQNWDILYQDETAVILRRGGE